MRLQDVQPQRFRTLDDLRAACPVCGSSHELLPPTTSDPRYFARCGNARCSQHYYIWLVAAELAQAYENLIRAEDMAYAAAEEEASNEE